MGMESLYAPLFNHSQKAKGYNVKDRHGNDGSNNANAKLNEGKVRAIKMLLQKPHISQRRIADIFGVHPVTIHHILVGKSWAHVEIE